MRLRRSATAVATASTLVIAALSSAGNAGAATSRLAVPQSAPQWLAKAQHLGKANKSTAVNFRVYLAPNGGLAAEQAAVARVSTPGTAAYRKYLSAAAFHAAYDPTAATVAAVRSWLASSGLRVVSVGEDNSYLQVVGNVAKAQAAFSTTINRYRHNGVNVQANSTALTIPSSVASAVLSVTGLDTTPATAKATSTAPAPDPVFRNARPCSRFYGQLTANVQADFSTPLPKFQGKYLPYAVCGYTGPYLRAAYEGASTLDGAGVTVGILDAYQSPTLAADTNQYASVNGDGSYAKGQFKIIPAKAYNYTTDCPDPAGWYAEQSLDIEAVHALAPAANIRYYGGASCEDDDLTAALRKVADQDAVQIVTNSYGDLGEGVSTGEVQASEAVFLQAALEGISVMFSSGDDGDDLAATGAVQTDYEASDPYVTAVGGTSTAIDGNGNVLFNTGWGTQKYSLSSGKWSSVGFLYGAGGGYSGLFNRPAYQNGVVSASAPPGRAVPDVAMDADPNTGMLIGFSQTFPDGSVQYSQYRIGGTSLASPLFAGMTALLVQHAGGGLGFLNPLVYSQHAKDFTDVKGKPADAGNVRVDYANSFDPSAGLLYSVRTFNQDASLTTTAGWDDVTGVGVPNGNWLTSISPLAKA